MSQSIRFTPAQAAAIRARGGSLLVSAAAGSGKTRVLVERAVGLITDPHHPIEADRLLIMTFTNAAAAKLRADITARLLEEVRAHPGDQRLRRQQLRLQRASIGTVDAFCLHFVQQNFASLEIPPDFQTADEATLGRLRQEALAAVLEQAYTDPDFRAFANLYDRGRTDDTAGTVILELYDFTRSLPHPDQALEAFAAAWQSDCPPQDTAWGRAVLDRAAARVEGILRLLEAALHTAVRDKAMDLLAARPLSRKELVDKLTARPRDREKEPLADRETAEAAADRLEELGYLNDGAYACTVAEHYAAKGWGPARIREELYRRGVPREYWDQALETMESPDDAIDAFLRKKLRGADLSDPKSCQRAAAALARRGFRWEDIKDGLRRYGGAEDFEYE